MNNGFVNGVLPLLIICVILLIFALVFYYLDDENKTYYGVGIAIALAILPAVVVWVVCVIFGINVGPWAIVSWILPFLAGVASLLLGMRYLVKTRRESDKETSKKLLKNSPTKQTGSKVKPVTKKQANAQPRSKKEDDELSQTSQNNKEQKGKKKSTQNTSQKSKDIKSSKKKKSSGQAVPEKVLAEAEIEKAETLKLAEEVETEEELQVIEETLLDFDETSHWDTSPSTAKQSKKK